MDKVKKCPFCGNDPVIESRIVGRRKIMLYTVQCEHCKFNLGKIDSEEEAIKRWNTRVGGETTMEQCPKCRGYMQFHMEYSCGNPVIYYTCPQCGYDTRSAVVTVSTLIGEYWIRKGGKK